ncbi:LamG-like jellyroll fold domain-containing protein [Niabella hirudinis]|uniref:LamG-like jellyroll fold domain-containing protein n=1 Tax=Niabella hirudinis TaxID=1285929 RepID=UPI003EBF594C
MHTFYTRNVTALLLLLGLTMVACNKPFPNPLDGGPGADETVINRKVLLIEVDGGVGSEVRDINPPTLNNLTSFSMYSWDGLSNPDNIEQTNALGWATLLTGVNSAKHQVTGNDFATNNFAQYPSLFTRIKAFNPTARTVSFSSAALIPDGVAKDATEKKALASDAETKNAAVTELKSQNPAFMLVQFGDVDAAGLAGSYSAEDAGYKAAVLTTDQYIGEILEALKSRQSYKSENWMVIITSNKGSNTGYDPGAGYWYAFNDQRHNTFFFSFNPRFVRKEYNKPEGVPYAGTAPVYNGTQAQNKRARVFNDGGLYDMGETGSYTIQCKVRIPQGSYGYPAFLSKRAGFSGGKPGWVFFLEGNYWQINFGRNNPKGTSNRQVRGHAISDGKWHALTAVIKQEGAARNVYTYTDGALYTGVSQSNRNITDWGNINSPEPLTVGNLIPDNNTNLSDYLVTDIRIYNTDLPESYIGSNYCKTEIAGDDPYNDYLLGFWPGTSPVTQGNLTLLEDRSKNKHPFTLSTYSPTNFVDVTDKVCPLIQPAVYKTVPNVVDVSLQVYQWLGIAVPDSWKLDGRYWIPAFNDLQ